MLAHSINTLYFYVNTLAKLKNRFWNWCNSSSRETHLLQIMYLAYSVGRWGHRYLKSNELPAPKSTLAIGLKGSQHPTQLLSRLIKEKIRLCVWNQNQEPLVSGLLCILSIIKSFCFSILKQFQLLISSSHFSAGCLELLISCSTVHLSKVIWLSFLWLITK